ncbi:MAG: hypothetical protein H3C45_08175 [Bacteroidia bacterium]|nr:hypothetical protein [Bacteroidia bacterium]
MKTLQLFFLITLSALHLQSCKQPYDYVPPTPVVHCDSNNTVLIPEDMKARFYFKEGTYWIYKNINTGETDSMWVWLSQNKIEPTNPKISQKGLNKCYEWFSFQTRNKLYINEYYSNISSGSRPKDGNNLNDEHIYIKEFSPLNNYRGDFRIEIKGSTYETQTDAEILFEDSILTEENLIYKNILNLKYPSTNTNDIYSDMYYAKNIGLVKFVRSNDNSTWELIRYKINQ